jgi:hypothetical protein
MIFKKEKYFDYVNYYPKSKFTPEVLKMIAGNIKELAGDWDGVWSNIELRGRIKEELVNSYDNSINSLLF